MLFFTLFFFPFSFFFLCARSWKSRNEIIVALENYWDVFLASHYEPWTYSFGVDFQIHNRAMEVWESDELLDAEHERREAEQEKRKNKKYAKKMKGEVFYFFILTSPDFWIPNWNQISNRYLHKTLNLKIKLFQASKVLFKVFFNFLLRNFEGAWIFFIWVSWKTLANLESKFGTMN